MATDAANLHTSSVDHLTELETLHRFLGRLIKRGGAELSIDTAMRQFAIYFEELTELRGSLDEARASLDRGEGKPLDLEALNQRVRMRLAEQGIVEPEEAK